MVCLQRGRLANCAGVAATWWNLYFCYQSIITAVEILTMGEAKGVPFRFADLAEWGPWIGAGGGYDGGLVSEDGRGLQGRNGYAARGDDCERFGVAGWMVGDGAGGGAGG